MDALGVYNQLKAKGRAVIVRVTTTTGENGATGDPGTPATRDYTTYAVEMEMTYEKRIANAQALGIEVAMKEKRFMLAVLDSSGSALPELSTAMQIVDGSSVLSVVDPGPFKPAGELLYYAVQARGA